MREKGNISNYVIVTFDEMYLRKCEKYWGRETFGTDEYGELHKEVVYLIIVGLKSNVSYPVSKCMFKVKNGNSRIRC